jgi:acid stress-induced BolA-like protein IbaG/YrbA
LHRIYPPLAEIGPTDAVITVERDGQGRTARAVSPAFRGQDDALRQSLVRGHLLARLSGYRIRDVEFVFTDAPEEVGEAA